MSLHPQEPSSAPEETCRIARAAFPKGTLCLHIADALGAIYKDEQFAALLTRRGQPAEATLGPGHIGRRRPNYGRAGRKKAPCVTQGASVGFADFGPRRDAARSAEVG
jgi:hypothetical protein